VRNSLSRSDRDGLQKPGAPPFYCSGFQSQCVYSEFLWGAVSTAPKAFCFQGDITGCEKKRTNVILSADFARRIPLSLWF